MIKGASNYSYRNIKELPTSTLLIGGAYAGKSEFAVELDPDEETTVLGTGTLDDPIFQRRVQGSTGKTSFPLATD